MQFNAIFFEWILLLLIVLDWVSLVSILFFSVFIFIFGFVQLFTTNLVVLRSLRSQPSLRVHVIQELSWIIFRATYISDFVIRCHYQWRTHSQSLQPLCRLSKQRQHHRHRTNGKTWQTSRPTPRQPLLSAPLSRSLIAVHVFDYIYSFNSSIFVAFIWRQKIL